MAEQLSIDWSLDGIERRVVTLLRARRGIGQAITVAELARLVGIGDRRLQTIIRRLCVEHGEPILSGGAGIWYAATADELLASYREQRRKAISTLIRQRRVYRRHLARLAGQLPIVSRRDAETQRGSPA